MVEVLFLEANEEALVRRYRETRRRHPLAPEGNVVEGIRAERKALSTMREVADRILDTSTLTVHQLKDRLIEMYVTPGQRTGLTISLVSFGFKHGVPFDADLVFDVRFLPNPHFVEELRPLDGRDARVREFILAHEESRELLGTPDIAEEALRRIYLLTKGCPLYLELIREGDAKGLKARSRFTTAEINLLLFSRDVVS